MSPDIVENLTAYLDHELDDHTIADIENALEGDAELRESLGELCRQRAMLAYTFSSKKDSLHVVDKQQESNAHSHPTDQTARRTRTHKKYHSKRSQKRKGTTGIARSYYAAAAAILIFVLSYLYVTNNQSTDNELDQAHVTVNPILPITNPETNPQHPPSTEKTVAAHTYLPMMSENIGEIHWISGTITDEKILAAGDRFRTAHDGQASLTFADGTTLVVKQDTEVSIHDLKRIELFYGDISGSVTKQKNGDKIIVSCLNGEVTVIGTEFEVQQIDKHTKVSVQTGSVAYTSRNSEKIFSIKSDEYFEFVQSEQDLTFESWAIGTIIGRTKNGITVENSNGPETYTPFWSGGAQGHFDRSVTQSIKQLKNGDRVRLRWTFDERLRVYEIKKIH